MPLYTYRDENGNEIVVKSSWEGIKSQDGKPTTELEAFLTEAQETGDIMDGVVVPGASYKRVMCSPALRFKGAGWATNDLKY